jgi:hypothetical protein
MYMDQALLSEQHQKRYEALIATREELVKRHAEVIHSWESKPE